MDLEEVKFLRLDTESTNYTRNIDKMDLIKIEPLCSLKDLTKKMKR